MSHWSKQLLQATSRDHSVNQKEQPNDMGVSNNQGAEVGINKSLRAEGALLFNRLDPTEEKICCIDKIGQGHAPVDASSLSVTVPPSVTDQLYCPYLKSLSSNISPLYRFLFKSINISCTARNIIYGYFMGHSPQRHSITAVKVMPKTLLEMSLCGGWRGSGCLLT